MASHNYSAPPPPPPPPANTPQYGQSISAGRAASAVRPGIITQGNVLAHTHGNLQTPASTTSLSSFSPFASNTISPYTPSPITSSPMAVPYNPQQWTGNGRPSVQYAPQTQMSINPVRPQDLSGHEEAMPSPPPPYTPAQAHSQNISQALSSSPGHTYPQSHPPPPLVLQTSTSSSARPARNFHNRPVSIAIPSGSAPVTTANPQFAPPPVAAGRERSSSRGLSNKFSLSNFRNRNNDHSPAPSAIESLHMSTNDALQRGDPGSAAQRNFTPYTPSPLDRRWVPDTQSPIRPPNSRRAASAGVLGHGTETRTPIDETPHNIQSSWGPGMPLPPPPPGPPPSSSRSQSVGPGYDSDRTPGYRSTPPTRRPGQTALGPIPPTPMGWEDESIVAPVPAPAPVPASARSPPARDLHIDTSSQAGHQREHVVPPPETESESTISGPSSSSHSGSGHTLSRPRREGSARGSIRERREESRAARERRSEPSNNPWAQDLEITPARPANLDLASPESGLSRRGAITRGTPRSGGAMRSPRSAHLYDDPGSANSTPRINTHPRTVSGAAPTPPFSPGTEHISTKVPAAIPAKALPTPPPHSAEDERGLTTPSGVVNRSVSQTSLQSVSTPYDLSLHTPKPTDRNAFAQASIERHRAFIEREMQAENDEDRLGLFAEFIVTESRFRRDRYSSAFDAMGGEVMDLTRDLWRSNKASGRRAITPSAQFTPSISRSKRSGSVSGESPDTRPSDSVPTTAASPASSRGQFTPHTEPASPCSASSQRARDASWSNNYHPSLSPIPSMAMSTIPDEEDSRGRSASRWWESDDGSQGVGGRRLERSKRESKYMGLVMETQESFHWDGEQGSMPKYRASSSSRPAHGADEYPPEKVDFQDGKGKQPASHNYFLTPTPPAIDSHKLDVSRLVTLPPPYPRHHPAVNNNHPDLASIRSSLRTLSDLGDVKTTKAAFETKTEARKESESASLSDRRAQVQYNIQENLRNGQMNFQDAVKADAEFESREHQRAQDVVQNVFDTFQAEVANTLHAMFCERITKVTASIEHLKGRLCSEAQELNPNQTQEEGDEKPELLEMLTLLKWLFELREQLHKELFELENERNDLYRDIIVLPYVQAKNDQKVKEATDFFRHDAQDRKVTFEKEILKRYEEFLEVIERNVTRGVETQLSAFWDIAPGLLAIVQKVPHRLDDFDILIPAQEYSENPTYHDFPLQYLYTLLAHAGRSAYQFIESQINLLCLLHEVKTAVMTAGSRLLETQRLLEGENLASVDHEMKAIRADEERRLTDDLKEKVGLVESQWNEALGQGLRECKTKVEEFLTTQGGWDDSLSE